MGNSVDANDVKNGLQYKVLGCLRRTSDIVTIIGWFDVSPHKMIPIAPPDNMRDMPQTTELHVKDSNGFILRYTKHKDVDPSGPGGMIWDGTNRITFHTHP